MTCASCGHRYLVSQTHFRHVPTPRPEAPASSTGKAAPVSTAVADPAGRGGACELSEVMRIEAERERDSKFDDYDTLAPTADEPRKPLDLPVEPEPVPVKKTKAQKAGRGGYLLAAAGALALAVLGIGLWAMNSDLGAGGSGQVNAEDLPPPEPVYDGPIYQGLPLAGSTALEHHPWTQPNGPYQSSPQVDPDIFAADNELVPTDTGDIEYVGQVITEGEGMIVSGEMTISLVNRQGTERARTTLAIALTSKDYPMQVRLPIPASLDSRLLTPVWSIQVNESSDELIPVEDVFMETQFAGSDAMARVILTNDTGLHTDHTDLLITAWDAQGLPLRYWHVRWPMGAAPGRDAEFYARTGVNPSWEIDHWTVLAFAQPAAIQPEPTPAEPASD